MLFEQLFQRYGYNKQSSKNTVEQFSSIQRSEQESKTRVEFCIFLPWSLRGGWYGWRGWGLVFEKG